MLRKINSPFAPGVAGVDEFGHVVALDELFEDAQAVRAPLNRLQIEMRRDDRQILEAPFALRGLDARRRHDGQQMADGRRDDELVVLEIILMLLKLAERLAMSLATDGFSAMMSALPMTRQILKPPPVPCATQFLFWTGEFNAGWTRMNTNAECEFRQFTGV